MHHFHDIKMILLGILMLLTGLILIVLGVTEPDSDFMVRVFMVFCGLIFVLPVVLVGGSALKEAGALKKQKPVKETEPSIYPFYPNAKDRTPLDGTLSAFRRNFSDFYGHTGIRENEAVQNDITQLYRSVLAFRKRRLDKKGITFDILSERKNYGRSPTAKKTYFDGKYEITEVTETVAAKSVFRKNGKEIYSRLDTEAADYLLTGTQQVGADTVICPGCGNQAQRSSLLDGCDYCGTVFTVEDLGTRISDFTLRSDYGIEYDKYTVQRSHFGTYAFWITAAVTFIGVLLFYIINSGEMITDWDTTPLVSWLVMPLAAGFAAAIFGFLGMFFFWFTIFPFLQIKASVKYLSGKALKNMKRSEEQCGKTETAIRLYDPLFSGTGFSSGVVTRLACIHYAETEKAANAFSEEQNGKEPVPKVISDIYKNVIDMRADEIAFERYRIEKGFQLIDVRAALTLTEEENGRVTEQKENVGMTLVKAEDCRTQAVCGPAVFRCRSCGASVSLSEGKRCEYCGTALDLSRHDWVIRNYKTDLAWRQYRK